MKTFVEKFLKYILDIGKCLKRWFDYKKNHKLRIRKQNKEKNLCECIMNCNENVTVDEQLKLYNDFWSVSNIKVQMKWIQESVEKKNTESSANANAFNLNIDNKKVKVCKTFFQNVFGIPENYLKCALSKCYQYFKQIFKSARLLAGF